MSGIRRASRRFQSTLPTRGSDASPADAYCSIDMISIHAPHEGERRTNSALCCSILLFQSTLPTRGSDFLLHHSSPFSLNFNPRSPRGGATNIPEQLHFLLRFQSTLPTRGSDIILCFRRIAANVISIHAPHEGERRGLRALRSRLQQISIHAPHEGERLKTTTHSHP